MVFKTEQESTDAAISQCRIDILSQAIMSKIHIGWSLSSVVSIVLSLTKSAKQFIE